MVTDRDFRLTPTDEQLVARYQSSADPESAGDLVRRYLPRVRRIVFPMVLDHSEADDVTQEVMIRAIRGLKRFEGKSSLATWITRIALNTTYTFLQRRKKRAPEPLPNTTLDRSKDHCPLESAIGHELHQVINDALQELSPKLRAAIVLTAIEAHSVTDAAEIESCTVSTMHWRIHEARKKLGIRLKDYVQTQSNRS